MKKKKMLILGENWELYNYTIELLELKKCNIGNKNSISRFKWLETAKEKIAKYKLKGIFRKDHKQMV